MINDINDRRTVYSIHIEIIDFSSVRFFCLFKNNTQCTKSMTA